MKGFNLFLNTKKSNSQYLEAKNSGDNKTTFIFLFIS